MASGNTIFTGNAASARITATVSGQPASLAGASTPNEIYSVIQFGDAADAYIDFPIIMSSAYSGGGLTLYIGWTAATATTATWRVGAAFRYFVDGTDSLVVSHSYSYQTAAFAIPGGSPTAGTWFVDTIAFTDGAQIDSIVGNKSGILRIFRDGDGTSGTDDLSGNVYVRDFFALET